jgi:hypothetical protein
MAHFDGTTVAVDEGRALCLIGASDDGSEGWRAVEAVRLATGADGSFSAAAGPTGRQISIEAWALDAFGRDLHDLLAPPARGEPDDLIDEPGRQTEMPDETIVGGWLGTDDDLADDSGGNA